MVLRLGEMTWPEVAEVLKKPNAIILTVGATEEGGYHMPLNFANVIFSYIAEKSADKVTDQHPKISVNVAPTIP